MEIHKKDRQVNFLGGNLISYVGPPPQQLAPNVYFKPFDSCRNSYLVIIIPHLSRKQGTLNLIRQSVCHKNFNLAHIF